MERRPARDALSRRCAARPATARAAEAALSAQFWSLLTLGNGSATHTEATVEQAAGELRLGRFGSSPCGPYNINEREVSPLFVYVSNSMWYVVQSVVHGVPSLSDLLDSSFTSIKDYST